MHDMHGADATMKMHYMHILMDHGLEMVAEGSNLAMLAEMKTTASLNPMTMEHGRHMMKEGKEVIEHALIGPEMMAMHNAGHGDMPLMKYTHELGSADLSLADLLENMDREGPMTPDMMTKHCMHVMINHALVMVAQGANLVMLGQMGMTGEIDKYSIDHWKMMLAGARALLNEVMEGQALNDMHQKGVDTGNAMMVDTHKLSDAVKKIIDLPDQMSPAGASMKMLMREPSYLNAIFFNSNGTST
jgi:hypothetical protein